MSARDHVGGILNLTGVRPGEAFAYDGPTMPGMVWYSVTITTTHEAIDKLVMPPPLVADRSLPAELTISYFVNRHNRAFDGRTTPYQGFLFTACTQVDGQSGVAGWEYVDGLYGDKTEMDIMGPWSVYFGMLKKMADIHFLPLGGDVFEITVVRRGVRLATMRLRQGAQLSDAAVKAMAEGSANAAFGTFTVREIPDASYEGFVERGIYYAGSKSATIHRAWQADEGSIEFGHLEQDPWTDLPVFAVNRAMVLEMTVPKEVYQQMRLFKELPRHTKAATASTAADRTPAFAK